ncbi:MAG TPA: hypothetical protein VGD74_12050 [Vulgatibacter sp.]
MRMNKLLTIAIATVVLSISGSAAAESMALGSESSARPTRTITANPLALAFGIFSLEYEQAIADRQMSFFAGPTYYSWKGLGIDLTAIGANGGIRYFFKGTAPEGFFVSPELALLYTSAGEGDAAATAMSWGLSGLLGYTWIFGDVFDLSLGLGVSYQNYEVKVGDATAGVSGILPTGRLALGAAF